MNFTALLIGLGIVILLFVVGKIFSIFTKILLFALVIAIIAIGFFLWQNYGISLIHL